MKGILLAIFMTTLASNLSFAAEINADCSMMRESNLRDNPKQNLGIKKVKTKSSASSVKVQ